jgi:GNAT superfamily N-acetyltransferase
MVFAEQAELVAYALYREEPALVYLRQFFVRPDRRRTGLGRDVIRILHFLVWPRGKRLTVEVLSRNKAGIAFWRANGYQEYSLMLEAIPFGSTALKPGRGSARPTRGGKMKAGKRRPKTG